MVESGDVLAMRHFTSVMGAATIWQAYGVRSPELAALEKRALTSDLHLDEASSTNLTANLTNRRLSGNYTLPPARFVGIMNQ